MKQGGDLKVTEKRLGKLISMFRRSERRPVLAFVISAPRSGTTWLQKALNAHPAVYCGENRLFGMHHDTVRDSDGTDPRVRITLDRYVDSLLLHYNWQDSGCGREEMRSVLIRGFADRIQTISAQCSGKRIVVDKITPYAGTVGVVVESISEFFPEARIIQLIRDGRDVLTSGVFHWLTKTHVGSQDDEVRQKRRDHFVKKNVGTVLTRFFTDAEIEEWCKNWVETLSAVEKLRERCPVIAIRYEDMAADMRRAMKTAFEFLGAKTSDKVLQECAERSSFERMSGGRQRGDALQTAHIRKGVVGDWKHYFTRRDGEIFVSLAGRQLCDLGYVDDAEWVRDLPRELQLHH